MAIRPTSNNMAELEALEVGLYLCIEVGISKVVIEGDSQNILNAIRKCSTPNWILNSKLGEVLDLLNSFEDCQIRHIYCEGNQKADHLASKGVDGVNIHLVNDLLLPKDILHYQGLFVLSLVFCSSIYSIDYKFLYFLEIFFQSTKFIVKVYD